MEGGVVTLDDILNVEWMGVIQAATLYVQVNAMTSSNDAETHQGDRVTAPHVNCTSVSLRASMLRVSCSVLLLLWYPLLKASINCS